MSLSSPSNACTCRCVPVRLLQNVSLQFSSQSRVDKSRPCGRPAPDSLDIIRHLSLSPSLTTHLSLSPAAAKSNHRPPLLLLPLLHTNSASLVDRSLLLLLLLRDVVALAAVRSFFRGQGVSCLCTDVRLLSLSHSCFVSGPQQTSTGAATESVERAPCGAR